MKKTLLFVLALTAMGALAQSLKFGKPRARQQERKVMVDRQANKASQSRMSWAAKANFIPIDEAQTLDDNGHIFRYVYGYDKDGQRSSEAIYCKEKQQDGSYVDKGLVVRGTYQYQYDTKGRLCAKSVDYGTTNNDYGFYSYFVQVNYQDDGKVLYVKYVKGDNALDGYGNASEMWSYYPDGKLAMYTTEGDGQTPEYYKLTEQGNVKETGLFKGWDQIDKTLELMPWRTTEGELNDSTITHYGRIYSSSDTNTRDKTKVEHYKYSPTGLLLEYTVYGSYGEDCKTVYAYDDLGRIVSWKKYYANDDDSDAGYASNMSRGMNEWDHSAEAPATEPEWQAEPEFCQTWTYLDNTTVWGVGNPWHDVFNLDGPATEILLVDEDYTTRNTFEWTAPGKLKSYKYYDENIDGVTEDNQIEVDADGHIVKNVWTSKESYGDKVEESVETTTYKWDGDNLVSASEVDESSYGDNKNKTVFDYTYTFGDNSYREDTKQFDVQTDGVPSETSSYSLSVTRKGNTLRCVKTNTNLDEPYITVLGVQDEDVTFTIPNILKDMEGFTADVPIVASQKGRVVAASNHNFYGINEGYNLSQADELYLNVLGDHYCSIEHDGEQTVGRSIEGLPLFILKGSQLQTIFAYYDEDYSEVVPASRAISLPAGKAYEEINFTYNDEGQLVGQQVTEVKADGTRTETIKLEYKYDPTGIGSLQMDTRVGVNLQGRLLNLKNGAVFSVFSLGGSVLAEGVDAYTFQTPGIYLVKVGKQTVKVNVK